MPSIRQAWVGATRELQARGSPTAQLDAEVILRWLLGVERAQFWLDQEKEMPEHRLRRWVDAIERRSRGEPVAYITGRKEFMGLSLRVSPAVLIPRPDTELLVEEALAYEPRLLADVGTGSGCMAVALACLRPEVQVVATDLSLPALEVARRNARRHGVDRRVQFLAGDLLEPLRPADLVGRLDLVVSNPPYVPRRELDRLREEGRGFEPLTALDGGEEGLEVITRLAREAGTFLRPRGRLLLEIGAGQWPAVRQILRQEGWGEAEVREDYAGIPRVVRARRP